jgi:DNA-binding IclR family transcriptional regulator
VGRDRDITAALDVPRNSLHELLRTLVAQGWVRSDASGTLYRIGIRALLVGTSYLDTDPYLPMITPFIDDLRHDLDETFRVGRLDGTDVVYLATRESKQYLRTSSRVGRRLPAYTTALGKALLADRFGADRDKHVPASSALPLRCTTCSRPRTRSAHRSRSCGSPASVKARSSRPYARWATRCLGLFGHWRTGGSLARFVPLRASVNLATLYRRVASFNALS